MHVAIVVLAGTETHEGLARVVNALETAKELKQAGDTVTLVFDGAGTEGLATLSDPAHRAHPLLETVRDRVEGACSFCARAFKVREKLIAADFPLLSEFDSHPSLRRLLQEGYQILTF
ncbi:MAG: hypothetical protein NVS2B7_28480 [Herpetosiphon sp.]